MKSMKSKRIISELIFVFCILFAAFMPLASANWIIGSALSGDKAVSEDKAVCYSYVTSSGSSSTKTYYASLASALDKTNDSTAHTIVMIPGDSTTIYTYSGTHTLGSNDTLILPYNSSEQYGSEASELSTNGNYNFSDANPSSYRKMQLVMEEKSVLKISSNSSFYVGGVRSANGTAPEGITSGYYTEIEMNSNSSIINSGGTIKCFGFIKNPSNNAIIELKSGATIYDPMVVYDWPNGGPAVAVAFGNVIRVKNLWTNESIYTNFPFHDYNFPNIFSEVKINSGSYFYGTAYFNGTGGLGQIIQDVQIVGPSNALFNLTSGSLSIKTSNSDEAIVVSSKNSFYTRNQVILNGKMSFGKVELDVTISLADIIDATGTINSSNYYMPISPFFDIEVCNGSTFSSSYKIKFMPSSTLMIDYGGKLTSTAGMIFYQSLFNGKTYSYSYTTKDSDGNETTKTATKNADVYGPDSVTDKNTPARFINNGSITLNCPFSGYIETSGGGASITTGSSFSEVTDCEEAQYLSNYTVFTKNAGKEMSVASSFDFGRTFDYFNELNVLTKQTLTASKTYTSTYDVNNTYGYGVTSVSSSINGSSSFYLSEGKKEYSLSTLNLIGNSVEWTSSDTSVATITQSSSNILSATLTPLKAGTITLKAIVKNGTSTVQTFSKEVTIIGDYLDYVIKDSEGNELTSGKITNATSGTVDVSNYTKEIVSGSCTNDYNLPDYKELRTITGWKVTNETTGSTSTYENETSSIEISGSNKDKFVLEPLYTTKYYNLVYMSKYSFYDAVNDSNDTYGYVQGGNLKDDFTEESKNLQSTGAYGYFNGSIKLAAKGASSSGWHGIGKFTNTQVTQVTYPTGLSNASLSWSGEEKTITFAMTDKQYYIVTSTGSSSS